jgi:hypothetical protein
MICENVRVKCGNRRKSMAAIKPIIKSALSPSSKHGNLKRKLEDIDPIDEIEEPKSMILLCERAVFVV